MLVPYHARDLEGHALVAYHLRERFGHRVTLTNGYHVERKILEGRPDAVVFDHLAWDFKVRQARMVRELGGKVVVLPTEGLFQDEEGAVRRAGKLHGASGLVDCYLAWGAFPQRAIVGQGLLPPERVPTPGCPRFDLYRAPFTAIRPSRAEFARGLGLSNPDAPIVLWATNTPYASRNPRKMLMRQTKRARKPVAEVQAHIEDHVEQLTLHGAVVEQLAARHPEWNFVIKVHPAEWINPYAAMAERHPNVVVAYNAPIHTFLQNCDVLLQRNCTTATEAWILGKPVINLEIGTYRRPVRQEYRQASHGVEDVDDAEMAIRHYLDGGEVKESQQAARRAFIDDFYGPVDGEAALRCASHIASELAGDNYPDERARGTAAKTAEAHEAWRREQDLQWTNKVKDLIGVDRSTSLRFWKRLLKNEAKDNLGRFVAEAEITPELVTPVMAGYERVLGPAGAVVST